MATTDPHQLRMTAYPPGTGPYDRYEVTVEATGQVIISGAMPFDQDAVWKACDAYHASLAPTPPAASLGDRA